MSFLFLFRFAFLIPICSLLLGCNPSVVQDFSSPYILMPNNQILHLEIVNTPIDLANGLMYREFLPEDQGMLFVFKKEKPLSFWMKNTLIPLDIIYMDSKGLVVDIQRMKPCPSNKVMCPSYPSAKPAMFAIEMNAGQSEYFELSIGDMLSLPSI